ncbi:MAG: hypothetical protein AAGN82_32485 [Myxococcota bacterium]
MREPAWRGRGDTALRITGATFGSLGLTALASAAGVRWLPVAPDAAITVTVMLFLPVWAALILVGLLPARGWRSWAWFAGGTAVFALAVWLGAPPPT